MRQFAASGVSADPDIEMVHEVWGSEEYEIIVRYMDRERGRGGALHLSIKRRDREPARDWRHLQSIKNEICGSEREGFEMFPAESRLVDQANQTHLWVMAAHEMIGAGFPERMVMTEAQSRAKMRDVLGPGPDKGRQRDWQPGLSTGPNPTSADDQRLLRDAIVQDVPESADTIKRRDDVVTRVCEERGWDKAALTMQQVLEIRADPEWA